MSGIQSLETLLQQLNPCLQAGEYVFCAVNGTFAEHLALNPIGLFSEAEGITLILPIEAAQQDKLTYQGVFKQITLNVYSSLESVGLTAAVSKILASKGISANVVAAFHHDHIFVPKEKAHTAMAALRTLAE